MQAVCGIMVFVEKIRKEISCPLNIVQRFSHCPDADVIACTKLIVFYLLATEDAPWRVDAGPHSKKEDLTQSTTLPRDYEFDMLVKKPLYPFNVCDAALGERGSRYGIAHMVGGAMVGGGSATQHSIATNSMTAESFAATSCVASGTLARDLVHVMGFPQMLPAPYFVDNTATVDVGMGDAAMKRSQFIRKRIYMFIQAVFEGIACVFPVAGKINPTDPMTKIVTRQEWMRMRKFIMNWR